MGGPDTSNAELGIAIQDAIAADARMQGKDGLAAQQAWGITYLNERIMGMATALALLATPFVLLNMSARIGVLWVGGLFLAVLATIWARGAKKKNIEAVRAAQLAAHRRKNNEGAIAPGTGPRD